MFAAAVTLMLILDTGGTAALGVASCLAHESGHLLFLLLFGDSPRKIHLGAFGMRIERNCALKLSLAKECAIVLAGPIFNLVLAGLFALSQNTETSAFRNAALVNLGLALFNLLPIEALDGGRALYYILCASSFGEDKARRICGKVSLVVLIPLICLGVALLVVSGYNFTLLIVSVYLFLLLMFKKK